MKEGRKAWTKSQLIIAGVRFRVMFFHHHCCDVVELFICSIMGCGGGVVMVVAVLECTPQLVQIIRLSFVV